MACKGTVKSFGPDKGFGFISSPDGGTQDIFLPLKECKDGMVPQVGDVVAFDVQESSLKPGQLQAANVTGGTGTHRGQKGGGPPGAMVGSVKTFNIEKGFGFIAGPDGVDVFLHRNAMSDGTIPQTGDQVTYDVESSKSKEGQFTASNVGGGTGSKGKGKGGWDSGKGYDKGGYGAAKGGSWDKGGSSPFDDGKGKGKKGKMMAALSSMMGGGWGGDSWGGGGGGWGGDSWSGGGDSWSGKGW